MQWERFSGETAGEPPCGVDLDDSGELFQLDMLAKWVEPEVEPDWSALGEAAAAALDRSRDLRVAVYLAAAQLHTDGILEFCRGLGLLRTLLESFWEPLYPRLDDGDAAERASALVNLTEYYKILKPLRTAVLVEDRAVGRFSLFDHEVALGKAQLPDDHEGEPPQPALIAAAFKATELEPLQSLDGAVRKAREDLEAIESLFRDRAAPDDVPDLKRLRTMLGDIERLIGQHLQQRDDLGVPTAETGAPTEPGNIAPAAATISTDGAIRSRDDAIRALDRVSAYFQNHEPSSPVPLLLDRAKRLVHMDFMSILEDMAPDAVKQIHTISGLKDRE